MRGFVYILLALSIWCGTVPAQAQDMSPQVTIELDADAVLVGQPLTLRIRILVPTWLPTPPQFPGFEVADVLTRLPERASSPISETIDGETWSGVQRAYRLYPLAAGNFVIPAQSIAITYADPDTTDPVAFDAPTPQIKFTGTLPPGAETLNPPILASGFTLEQSIEGEGELQVGGAITRTITAQIDGTTPILIPVLMPQDAADPAAPLRGYAREPVVTTREERGQMSGTRVETVSYVAQAGGTGELPPITFSWFNVETDSIETAALEGISVTIAEPPAPPWRPDAQSVIRLLAWAVGAAVLGWLLVRYGLPWLRAARDHARITWQGSERFAHHQVLKALRARRLSTVLPALEQWQRFFPDLDAAEREAILQALAEVGALAHSPHADTTPDAAWRALDAAFRRIRTRALHNARSTAQPALQPLNPH